MWLKHNLLRVSLDLLIHKALSSLVQKMEMEFALSRFLLEITCYRKSYL